MTQKCHPHPMLWLPSCPLIWIFQSPSFFSTAVGPSRPASGCDLSHTTPSWNLVPIDVPSSIPITQVLSETCPAAPAARTKLIHLGIDQPLTEKQPRENKGPPPSCRREHLWGWECVYGGSRSGVRGLPGKSVYMGPAEVRGPD